MAELATAGDLPMKAEVIADRQSVSLKYLLDILRDLKRAELIRSRRGPHGGFTLSRQAATITVADVFRAIDGPLADIHDSSLRDISYPAPADSLPLVWMAIRASLRRVLETISIADLANGELSTQVMELAAEYQLDTEARHP